MSSQDEEGTGRGQAHIVDVEEIDETGSGLLSDVVKASTATGRPFVVAVGASAGGLEALTQMFERGPALTGMSFIIAQHLSSDYQSLMPELLARHTEMDVVHARDGVVPAPDTVYVIEPATVLTFKDGRLLIEPAKKQRGTLFLPINALFESVAKELGSACAVVVLSGTGSDGSHGLRTAKTHGAITIAQTADSARFDGMPRAAVSTGAVDLVLSPDQVLLQLMQMQREGASHYFSAAAGHGVMILTRVLSALQTHTGVDFSYYKPATVVRRIERRMRQIAIDDAREYADRLYEDAAEARELHDALLIGVTRFLRDEGAIEAVRRIAIPRVLEHTTTDRPLRLWVPGCSTGQEAYSLAMLVQEALNEAGDPRQFKLFATDVDTRALEVAGAGEYSVEDAEQLPADLRDRYFKRHAESYQVKKELREKLLFSRHDLIKDPPFSHLDMVSCRNLLIYLKAPVQERVLRLFSAALRDDGLLWLGASETIGDGSNDFETLDNRWRLYSARPSRNRHLLSVSAALPSTVADSSRRQSRADAYKQVLEALQSTYVPPCLVVDGQGRLAYRFGAMAPLLRIPEGAVSLDVRDLLPDRIAVLVSAIIGRTREPEDVVYKDMRVTTEHGPCTFDLRARAISLQNGQPLIALFFEGLHEQQPTGASAPPPKTGDLTTDAHGRIEVLERELRQTRENLQATIEELESSNEELQATNEELIASNEELQSTNEELQSVNEELHTVNAEFSEKLDEVTRLNEDLDHLFASVDVGILLLDQEMNIRRFNPMAARYVNVLEQDIGRPFRHLSHRLTYPALADDCESALRIDDQIRRVVKDDKGTKLLVQVHSHTGAFNTVGVVVTFTDVGASESTKLQLGRLAVALEHSHSAICVIGPDDKVVFANSPQEARLGKTAKELRGQRFTDVVLPSEREQLHEGLARARAGKRWTGVTRGTDRDGQTFFELSRMVPAGEQDHSVVRISELLTRSFVPYEKLRGPNDAQPIGPHCYCVWSPAQEFRVMDSRLAGPFRVDDVHLVNFEQLADLAKPEDAERLGRVLSGEDVGFPEPMRFVPSGRRGEAGVLQVRSLQLEPEGRVPRTLVEIVELAGGSD